MYNWLVCMQHPNDRELRFWATDVNTDNRSGGACSPAHIGKEHGTAGVGVCEHGKRLLLLVAVCSVRALGGKLV